MELVANIWPIVDQETGIVQRYLIKAYALSATDQEISTVLTTLARSDYRTAHPVKISDKYMLTSEHGNISGAIPISTFHQEVNSIVEGMLSTIEHSLTEIHNYGVDMNGNPRQFDPVKFPENPYFVTTSLLESPSGELKPQL
jgi:hypothetical protein